MSRYKGRYWLCLAVFVLLTFRTEIVSAACPPTKTGTIVGFSNSECVLRPNHDTSGEYMLMCKTAPANGAVFVTKFTSNHLAQTSFALNDTVVINTHSVDAVDLGGISPNRWITSWIGRRSGQSYNNLWFRAYNAAFSPQSLENYVIDPVGSQRSRFGHAVDMLPATRRVVHVQSFYHSFPPNTCNGLTHSEWRAVINVREQSLTGVAGATKRWASDFCSWTSLHQGGQGWGQEYPDVSGSWFFGDFFAVVWYDRANSCRVYARLFNGSGVPAGPEILVDDTNPYCATTGAVLSPRVAATPGGFMVVWTRTDMTLWMRTFSLAGVPYTPARLVNQAPTSRGYNPDIDVAYVDACGQGIEPYFAISWWALQSGLWQPQLTVMKNISDPAPLFPGLGYVPLVSPGQTTPDTINDRVSLSFFSSENSNDSACDDLTLGVGWTVTNSANGSNETRTQFLRFTPLCEQSFTTAENDPQTDSSYVATPREESEYLFVPTPRPVGEPELVFPNDDQPMGVDGDH